MVRELIIVIGTVMVINKFLGCFTVFFFKKNMQSEIIKYLAYSRQVCAYSSDLFLDFQQFLVPVHLDHFFLFPNQNLEINTKVLECSPC